MQVVGGAPEELCRWNDVFFVAGFQAGSCWDLEAARPGPRQQWLPDAGLFSGVWLQEVVERAGGSSADGMQHGSGQGAFTAQRARLPLSSQATARRGEEPVATSCSARREQSGDSDGVRGSQRTVSASVQCTDGISSKLLP
jgi:hypothetical protein